jgi:glycosyltransferase involved in cell wall biosynthesis
MRAWRYPLNRHPQAASEFCSTTMIYADQRWIGHHGIGRFAKNVLAGLDYRPVPLKSHPAAPFDAWFLARALRGLVRNDIFFSPGYNTPLFCRAAVVFAIHDLGHLYCPENSSVAIRLYYACVMKPACRRAAKILTVSDFTRRQIIDWAEVPAEKVLNVGCGVDPLYRPGEQGPRLRVPYFLCVSNRKPHKNELRILDAFAESRVDPQIHLVFTGESTPDLLSRIASNQLSARVDFVGFVPESQLPSLYRGAQAMILPSLYEGFALPVLEAMACGTPVVTANVTAMPEVAGGAALLVDPTSVEEIARAMARIVSDSELREQCRAKGLLRAAEFSWVSTAAKVHELLKNV